MLGLLLIWLCINHAQLTNRMDSFVVWEYVDQSSRSDTIV